MISRALLAILVFNVSDVVAGDAVRPLRGGLDHELLDASAYPFAPAAMVEGTLCDVDAGGMNGVEYGLDGVFQPLPASADLVLCKGERFSDGTIEILKSKIEPIVRRQASGAGNRFAGAVGVVSGTRAEIKIRPSIDYRDVEVAVLFFTEAGRQAVELAHIGDLVAGEVLSAQFELPNAYSGDFETVKYSFLFFCREGEIVTNERRDLTPYLNRGFETWYQQLVYAYQQNSGPGVRPVSLVQQYPVEFSEIGTGAFLEEKAVFRLRIDDRGFVAAVATEAELPDGLLTACENSFREWLFLPRLEDGFAVPSEVEIPVLLGSGL